jgi:acetoin utilization deacetylase AcuC-like enzyme
MTLSFHQYGDNFFPGTGDYTSIGAKNGKNYCLNVPMKKGMDDDCYHDVFKDVTNRVIDHYRPNVIVFQLGADSLS